MNKWILQTLKRSWDFIHFIGKLFGLWKTLRNNIEKDNMLEKIMDESLALDRHDETRADSSKNNSYSKDYQSKNKINIII